MEETRAMTITIQNLLARKQELLEQLERAADAGERDHIERQIEQINNGLDMLEGFEGKESKGSPE